MAWITAISDLRIELSDGSTDRYHFRKEVFGELNGNNLLFKTFEFRRTTDFTQESGVFLNGNLLPISGVSSDDLSTGVFILVEAPVDGDSLEASYYSQWFIDEELQEFLISSSRWLLSSDDYTLIPGGLIPSALSYAKSRAYTKMAQRWRNYYSEMYKVEDAPQQKASGNVDSFIKMAEYFKKEATESRDEYYTRQGQALQPLFKTISGAVRNIP